MLWLTVAYVVMSVGFDCLRCFHRRSLDCAARRMQARAKARLNAFYNSREDVAALVCDHGNSLSTTTLFVATASTETLNGTLLGVTVCPPLHVPKVTPKVIPFGKNKLTT